MLRWLIWPTNRTPELWHHPENTWALCMVVLVIFSGSWLRVGGEIVQSWTVKRIDNQSTCCAVFLTIILLTNHASICSCLKTVSDVGYSLGLHGIQKWNQNTNIAFNY